MKSAKYELDMSKGPLLKNMIKFAVPLMLASMFNLFYNAADIIVVGRFASSNAMASVGACSPLINLLINFFNGFSIGTSIVVSRRYGEKNDEGVHRAVHTSILFSLIVGILVFVIGEFFARYFLKIMETPEGQILDDAVLYMQIVFIGKMGTIIYSFCAAVLRAVGDTKRSLYILAISGLVNVILNLIFVIEFGMGVEGVAWATTISQYLSVTMILVILVKTNGAYKLKFNKLKIYKKDFLEIVKIGIPAGVQGSVFNLANAVIQRAVNSFGAAAIAGNTAGANLEGFAYAIKNAFYQATVTSVSQCYGAKDETRMQKSVRTAVLCVFVGGIAISLVMTIFSSQLLGIYITDSKEAMEFGMKRLYITTLPYFLSGIMEILTGYLRGLGYSSISTVNSFVGVCGFRIFWVLVIFPLCMTYEMLYVCWPLSWLLVIVMHLISLKVVKQNAILKMYDAL